MRNIFINHHPDLPGVIQETVLLFQFSSNFSRDSLSDLSPELIILTHFRSGGAIIFIFQFFKTSIRRMNHSGDNIIFQINITDSAATIVIGSENPEFP